MIIYRNRSANLHRDNGPAVDTGTMIQFFQNGSLHNPVGPAVETVYGGRQYYWRGLFVPIDLWNKRFRLDINTILTWENAEMRRVLIEMRGWDRFIEEAGAKVIHCDVDREAVLYRFEFPNIDDEPIVVIKVKDSTPMPDGTHKRYFLRVPPSINTCIEALAWTFDLPVAAYKLEMET